MEEEKQKNKAIIKKSGDSQINKKEKKKENEEEKINKMPEFIKINLVPKDIKISGTQIFFNVINYEKKIIIQSKIILQIKSTGNINKLKIIFIKLQIKTPLIIYLIKNFYIKNISEFKIDKFIFLKINESKINKFNIKNDLLVKTIEINKNNVYFTKIENYAKLEQEIKIENTWPNNNDGKSNDEFFEIFKGSSTIKNRLYNSKPKIIIFKDAENDSYISFLKNILILLYREVNGSFPESNEIKLKKEKIENNENIDIIEHFKEKIFYDLKIGNKIITLDFDDLNNLDDFKENEKQFDLILKEGLIQSLTEPFGFLIFRIKNEKLKDTIIDKLLQFKNFGNESFDLYYIEINPEMQKEDKLYLSNYINGFFTNVKKENDIIIIEKISDTFDVYFNSQKKRYEETLLQKINNNGNFKSILFTNRANIDNSDSKESNEHYILKAFIVYLLINQIKKKYQNIKDENIYFKKLFEDIKQNIETEVKLGENIISDIRYNKNIIYEIETLFGQGIYPIKKLQEKILKYINNSINKPNSITELHIILEPLTLIINLNEIKELKQWLEFYKETNNKPINIYFETIDLSNEEYYLINFNKVIENLRNLNLKYIFDLKINEFL
ncbi:MAG: hypothetical protein ACP5IB_08600 [Thermoplasmata archaeon]